MTVLFADLVGFTARRGAAGPRGRARDALRRTTRGCAPSSSGYGGTVEKFIGDAVMAVFGAPVAHEDDPERAVRAALAIRDWAAPRTDGSRSGSRSHTGEALVSLGARAGAGEGMAAGDVVNTAARLQSAAPVDGILVGETTYRATRARDRVRRAPSRSQAKGKAEPIAGLGGASQRRARFGVDVAQRPRTRRSSAASASSPLLRDALGARAARARAAARHARRRARDRQEPARLRAVRSASSARPELIAWRQGRSLPVRRGRHASGRSARWSRRRPASSRPTRADEAEAKLAERSTAGLASRRGATGSSATCGRSSGSAATPVPATAASEAFAAWRRFFEALAEQRPAGARLRGPALGRRRPARLRRPPRRLGDAACRCSSSAPPGPSCSSAGRAGAAARRNAPTLSLAPLSDDETARLLGALLEQRRPRRRHAGGAARARRAATRSTPRSSCGCWPTGGVAGERRSRRPCRASSPRGSTRCRAEEKALLQDAAVLGKVFWPVRVAAIGGSDARTVEEQLHALERKEFVRRERRSSVAGEAEYAFRHVLVRDVAYAQIPRAGRADKHRLAAEWIESLGADRAEDTPSARPPLRAALEFARAAGSETPSSSAGARPRSATPANGRWRCTRSPAARAVLSQALELWPEDDPDWPTLALRQGRVEHDFRQAGGGCRSFARAFDRLLGGRRCRPRGRSGGPPRGSPTGLPGGATRHSHGSSVRAARRRTPDSASKARAYAELSRFLMLAGR